MRHIAAETFIDEFFGSLPMMMRVLWIGLIASVADDQGRFMDNPALIRSMIFPYDAKISIKDIDNGLNAFVKAHKIERYTAGTNGSGKRLVQILNWWKYQKGTQWARESMYPSPSKWLDRVRIHKPGNGNVPYTLHWDSEGGYVEPTKAVPTHLPRRYTKTKTNTKTKLKPPPIPSSKSRRGKAGGGGGKEKGNLSPEDKHRVETVTRILKANGLRNPRREKVAFTVATRRTVRDDMLVPYVMAAIASAYADKHAENKAVIAAHRLEEGEVSELFLNPLTWKNVPNDVLIAAGISEQQKDNMRLTYKDGQPVMVPA